MTRERARRERKAKRYSPRELAVMRGCRVETVYRDLHLGKLTAERNDSGRYWYVPEERAAAWLLRAAPGRSKAPGQRAPDKRVGRVRVRVGPRVWRTGELPNAEELRQVIAARRTPS